jgi:hypothetical protein
MLPACLWIQKAPGKEKLGTNLVILRLPRKRSCVRLKRRVVLIAYLRLIAIPFPENRLQNSRKDRNPRNLRLRPPALRMLMEMQSAQNLAQTTSQKSWLLDLKVKKVCGQPAHTSTGHTQTVCDTHTHTHTDIHVSVYVYVDVI